MTDAELQATVAAVSAYATGSVNFAWSRDEAEYHERVLALCDAVERLMAERDAARPELDELRKEYGIVLEGWQHTLLNEPQPNGRYAHHIFCNGDTRVPPGTPGVSCSCKIAPRAERDAARERARAAERDAKRWSLIRPMLSVDGDFANGESGDHVQWVQVNEDELANKLAAEGWTHTVESLMDAALAQLDAPPRGEEG